MRKAWALVLQSHSAPIAIAALLAVSFPAATETVNQHISISASPSDPIPNPSSMPYSSVPVNSIALPLLNADYSVSLPENLTASIHCHFPDTTIDTTFTFLGRPLRFRAVSEILELAIDKISTNLGLNPTESITDGFFLQRHDGLEINVYEYVDKQVTWSLLNQILLGIQYFASQLRRSCGLRFEIVVENKGRVGYGSLWGSGLEGNDVFKRAANETSQQLPIPRISKISMPALINANYSVLSPKLNESSIVFSYHFFGPTLPESAISMCLRLARQSIHSNVRLHPHDDLPDGFFQYRADDSDVSIGIKAYADREISWLLLDQILRDISGDLIGEHHLWACEFEFEIYPFEEPHGHGSLRYDAGPTLLANASRAAASAIKGISPQLRYANGTSNNPPNPTTSSPNPASPWVVVVPVPGTPICLLILTFGDPVPLWDVASTLSGARNQVLDNHGTFPNLPMANGRFQYNHAGSSVWVQVVATSGRVISWQDLNDVLKGLFDFLCRGTKARSRGLLFEIYRDGMGVVGRGLVSENRPREGVVDAW
ncbi:MAG: hypothetical protein Q9161_008236 [Pseudevernia consocians]